MTRILLSILIALLPACHGQARCERWRAPAEVAGGVDFIGVPVVQADTEVIAAVKSAAAQAPDPAVARQARELFVQRCSPCHGPEGRGDGPAGKVLPTRPRNFTDKAWHASITDGKIEETILRGGAAMGKSPLMPPNPDLAGKPELLRALRGVVRGFR